MHPVLWAIIFWLVLIGVLAAVWYGINKVVTWHEDCICSKCIAHETKQQMKHIMKTKKIKDRWNMEAEVRSYVREWEKTLR